MDLVAVVCTLYIYLPGAKPADITTPNDLAPFAPNF